MYDYTYSNDKNHTMHTNTRDNTKRRKGFLLFPFCPCIDIILKQLVAFTHESMPSGFETLALKSNSYNDNS